MNSRYYTGTELGKCHGPHSGAFTMQQKLVYNYLAIFAHTGMSLARGQNGYFDQQQSHAAHFTHIGSTEASLRQDPLLRMLRGVALGAREDVHTSPPCWHSWSAKGRPCYIRSS